MEEKEFSHPYLYILTRGFNIEELVFAQIPGNSKIGLLLEELKYNGFVSKDTKIEHFKVIFGIPLRKQEMPFEQIKWCKNMQLLRFFIYRLCGYNRQKGKSSIIELFANKRGKSVKLVRSDLKRLEGSLDYQKLVDILKKFNSRHEKHDIWY